MNDVLVILFVGLHVVWVVDGRGSPMIDSSAVSAEYNSRRAAVQQQQRREYKRREYMAYCAVLWPVRSQSAVSAVWYTALIMRLFIGYIIPQ